ncbi:methyltransferase family protein [Celeribacter sp.]|uniref:methyltransferase family protein n=1 Tax=Celeribacter sp. TaxID=1890673 RepID=UPI003A91F111
MENRIKITLDYPPVWLAAFLVFAYLTRGVVGPLAQTEAVLALSFGLIGIGIGVMCIAAFTMWRHKTTFIPHRYPQRLVTQGIFRYSRNPIYLGDAFTLVGFSLLYGSIIGLLSVPVFMVVIERRFIRKEEKNLKGLFAQDYDLWAKKTRRWM